MASHEYLRFLLKTPEGYLTPTGTTKDICNNDIIVLNIYAVGGFGANEEKMVRNFLKLSSVEFPVEKCQVLIYHCPTKGYYFCYNCPRHTYCDFWHNRKKCKIS